MWTFSLYDRGTSRPVTDGDERGQYEKTEPYKHNRRGRGLVMLQGRMTAR
jgi:hypothetical protein